MGWFDDILSIISPVSQTIRGVQTAVKEKDWQSALHRLSTAAPGIDVGLSNFGTAANKLSGGASGKFMNAAAPIVGSIWGPWGSAIGSMVAGRWNKDYYGLSEADIQKRTALTAGTAWATQGLLSGATGGVGSVTPTDATGALKAEIGGDYSQLGQGFQAPYTPVQGDYGSSAALNAEIGGDYSNLDNLSEPSQGGLLSEAWDKIPDYAKDKVSDLATDYAKKYGKQALLNMFNKKIDTKWLETPPPLPNWSYTPSTRTPEKFDTQKAAEIPASDVKFTEAELNKNYDPSLYTASYNKEAQEKIEEEKKKKEKEYLSSYLNKDYYSDWNKIA